MTAGPALLVALGAFVLAAPPAQSNAVERLRRLHRERPAPRTPPRSRLRTALGRRAAAAAIGIAAFGVVRGVPGVIAAVIGAVISHALLARLPDRAAARTSAAAAADLPLALDLMACALRAGQPPASAARALGTALGGELQLVFRAVARAFALGASADIAWQPVAQLPGGAVVARAAVRAAESGTQLSHELSRVADELRAARAVAAHARVRRAGVLVVLPLGLCFLPAFVSVGVVPLLIGVAASALR